MLCKNCGKEFDIVQSESVCPYCGNVVILDVAGARASLASAKRLIRAERFGEAREKLATAADAGIPEAEYLLGYFYEHGKGGDASLADAAEMYKKAAEGGHASGAYAYSRTAGADADFWLAVSAALSCADAEEALGFELNPDSLGELSEGALYWLDRAARRGKRDAAKRIAEHYYARGGDVDRTYRKWYLALVKAAKRGGGEEDVPEKFISPKINYPGNYAEDVFALAKSAAERGEHIMAARLYKVSSDLGYPRAQNAYAVCLESGRGVERDINEAHRLYEAAANAGFELAKVNLADVCLSGDSMMRDETRAFRLYTEAAEAGYAPAQYILGNCYFGGKLTKRDFGRAIYWYRAAALQGHPKAMTRAEDMHSIMTMMFNRATVAYDRGDYTAAFRYYTISSEMGHKGASCNLGYMYQKGLGCKRNRRLAAHCFELAAEAGSTAGAYNLGMCYLNGRGKVYDHKKARAWLIRAKEAGHTEADEAIRTIDALRVRTHANKLYSISSVMYRRGDIAQAIRFRAMAAKMGCAKAQYILGCHFEFGDGVEMNMDIARAWYLKAVNSGFNKTYYTRDRFLRHMSRMGRK